MHITNVCRACGKSFRPWPGRQETSKYCSRACTGRGRQIETENRDDSAVFFSKISKKESGCWEWTGSQNGAGYGKMSKGANSIQAHRFSYKFFKGNIGKGKFICHTCDNTLCVNPEHLFEGTPADNIADMINKGRRYDGPAHWAHGEKHRLHKLTAEQVRAIRNDGRIAREIAKDYGVSRSLIYAIKDFKTWKHL